MRIWDITPDFQDLNPNSRLSNRGHMKKFLDGVAERLLKSQTPLHRQHVVLPNRRAALFLKKALKSRAQKPLIAPKISSMEAFMYDLAGLVELPKPDLLLEFYDVVTRGEKGVCQGGGMRFESFVQWAPHTLRDFNDLDLYLVEPAGFFEYLEAERKLERWTLSGESPTAAVQDYLSFWKNMGVWYGALQARLLAKGLAYPGLSFRIAAENIRAYEPEAHLVFAGFNALTPAESQVVFHLLEARLATALWDADAHILQAEQEAGRFLRGYERRMAKRGLPFEWVSDHLSQPKSVVVHACPKNMAQAHTLGEILSQWCAQSTDLTDCAVVLADESLLPAVLNKIPKRISRLNPTMGFPVAQTQGAKLFAALVNARLSADEDPSIELKNLLEIAQNAWVVKLLAYEKNQSKTQRFLARAQAENRRFLTLEEVAAHFGDSSLRYVFQSDAQYMESLLAGYLKIVEFFQHKAGDLSLPAWEQAAAAKLQALLERALGYSKAHRFLRQPKSLQRFFALLLQNERVNVYGAPLAGLQIMGVLETRCLDFGKLALLSANEGILPAEQRYNTYIPPAIRRHFKMPTHQDREAVYAYHFYHLLQRCEEAHILYSDEATGLNGGEKSRFIRQYQSEIAAADGELKRIPSLVNRNEKRVIEKSESILARLRDKAESGISPSFLQAYLRDPIDFYYEKILGLHPREEVAETIGANTLGTILHSTLEILYREYAGEVLSASLFDAIGQQAESVYADQFQSTFSEMTTGYDKLVYEVFKGLLLKQIERDKRQADRLSFVSFERELSSRLPINGELTVNLVGKIDRLDQLDGMSRIIDYKTGRVDRTLRFDPGWDLEAFRRHKQAGKLLQLMLYTHFFFNRFHAERQLESGIIYLASSAAGNYVKLTLGAEKILTADSFGRFQPLLTELVAEIFNPDIPFVARKEDAY